MQNEGGGGGIITTGGQYGYYSIGDVIQVNGSVVRVDSYLAQGKPRKRRKRREGERDRERDRYREISFFAVLNPFGFQAASLKFLPSW